MATPAFAMVPSAMAPAPVLGFFESLLNTLNTSPYFIGIMMLTMNLGARFLSLEVTKGQEQFLSHPWVRRFLIFVVFFIGTRNIWVAFWMALIVILLLGYLLNENSSLCLFRGGLPGSSCAADGYSDYGVEMLGELPPQGSAAFGESNERPAPAPAPGLTPEEAEILQKLLAKQARMTAAAAPKKPVETSPSKLYSLYKENLDRVQSLF